MTATRKKFAKVIGLLKKGESSAVVECSDE